MVFPQYRGRKVQGTRGGSIWKKVTSGLVVKGNSDFNR